MPFLNGEVGGISKHVPTVEKEGCAIPDESPVFGCSSFLFLFYFVTRFAAMRFIVSKLLARTTFAMYVYTSVCICVHVLLWMCILYMSVHPSGKASNL